MKKLLAFILPLLAICAAAPSARAQQNGQKAPYIFTYQGDPTGVLPSVINPPIGAQVINPINGLQYIKQNALGLPGAYSVNELITAGSPLLLTGSLPATTTLTIAVNPTPGDTFTTGTQKYFFTGTNSSGTFATQSGSYNISVGTTPAITLTNIVNGLTSGTTSGSFAVPASNQYVTGSLASSNIAVNMTAITNGTAANATATTETFVSPYNVFTGTTLAGGQQVAAGGTYAAFTIPPNTNSFVFSSADVIFVSVTGTLTSAPSVSFATQSLAATGTLTLTAQPTAGDTITTGTQTYTYVAALTAPYQIQIQGTLPSTITATYLAINNSGTVSGTYGTPAVNQYVTGTTGVNGAQIVLTGTTTGTGLNGTATSGSFTAPLANFFANSTLVNEYTGATLSGTVQLTGTATNRGTHISAATVEVIAPPSPLGVTVNIITATGTDNSGGLIAYPVLRDYFIPGH